MTNKLSLKGLPCVTINSQKLKYNIKSIQRMLAEHQINAHFDTKAIAAHESILSLMVDSGIENFADSSLENLRKIRPFAKSILLNRLPMLSEVKEIVQHVDISVNSELDTIFALSDAAVVEQKKHGIILLVELGDLSAGILAENLLDTVHQILNLRGIELKGIGFNLNTFSGVRTTIDKTQEFAELIRKIERRFEIDLDYISGGNSGTINLISKEDMPSEINHLTIGQAWLLGRESSYNYRISDLNQDVFSLHAEILENKRKASKPQGEIGSNYRGEEIDFADIGTIRRIILAIGAQDVDVSGIIPKEKGIDFIGSTLDYSIYNVSKYNRTLNIGDLVELNPNYSALNRLFNSDRVKKVLL